MKRRKGGLLQKQLFQEIGEKGRAGDRARLESTLSSSVKVIRTWDPKETVDHTDHGGVFNFDFSHDGSILGVACERKDILMFDAFSGKMIMHKLNAHTDCVNCVKFLDSRLLATCSDDTTVALWDIRYLKHSIHVFEGHTNWVKNIEYAADQGILLTSGFDGCIYTWDINRFTESEGSRRVFYTSGLMRSKLSPDASKLLISTHEGYIMVVHNLDLGSLAEDLEGFKPKMYRLMQRSQTPLRIGLMYNHVFERKRNRVEFLTDWPTGNDASIISSLQVHPKGWCALSRNTDTSEGTEWTCVHDIQDNRSLNQKTVSDEREDSNDAKDNLSSESFSKSSTSVSSNPSTSVTQNNGVSRYGRSSGAGQDVRGEVHIENPNSPDSLIQIRRGPQTDEGQFQFSVSVHTSTGQTIQINNTDLDDSDSDVDIQVTPLDNLNDPYDTSSGSEDEDGRGEDEEEDEYGEGGQDVLINHPLSPSTSTDISSMFNRNALSEILSQRISEEQSRASATETSTSVQEVINNEHSNSSSSRSVNLPRRAHSTREGRRRRRNANGLGLTNQSAGTVSSDEAQSRAGNLMFLLRSAASSRILNLSYMGGYTETENSRLQQEIYQNSKRLLAYADECNVGRGFIKELAFNSDGRLICSPFGYGLRLFGFDPSCNELCDCVPSSPVKLYEITCSLAHANYVVASKFSPVHHLAVSGCLDGRIAFHQPVL